MTTAVALENETPTWRKSALHVRKALAFIKSQGSVTPEELVEWDRTHGQRLFDWNDEHAAVEWRKQQARVFMNSFRRVFDKMRVRGIIHVHEDADSDIASSGYVTVETIAEHPGMRAQIIADITKRMRVLAGELRMWKLSPEEQAQLFDRLADAIAGAQQHRAA